MSLITVASLALGLYKVGQRSLWDDEASTWLYTGSTLSRVWYESRVQGGHLFLYYAVVHFMTAWFGDSVLVLRLPSVVAGAASVPVVYSLTSRLASSRAAGVYAALLSTVSLGLVTFQQDARDYTFVVLLAASSTWLMVRGVEDSRWRYAALWALVTAVACYTHPEEGLLVAAQFVAFVVWPSARARWRPFLAAAGVMGGVSVPPLLFALDHPSFQSSALLPPSLATFRLLGAFLASAGNSAGSPNNVDLALVGVTCLVLLAALVGLGVDLAHHGRSPANFGTGLVLLWAVLPTLLAWVISEVSRPVITPRYLMVSLPAVSMTVAMVLARARPRALGVYGLVYLTVFRMGILVPTYGRGFQDFVGPTRYILANARPGDCITFYPGDQRALYDYYSAHLRDPVPGRPAPAQILPSAPNTDNTSVVLYYLVGALYGTTTAKGFLQLPLVESRCQRVWVLEALYGSMDGTSAQQAAFSRLELLRNIMLLYYQPPITVEFLGVTVQLYQKPVMPK